GIEGTLVYTLSASLRDWLQGAESASNAALLDTALPDTAGLTLDWLPDRSPAWIEERLGSARPGASFANLLRKTLRLPPIASSLLRECCPDLDRGDPAAVSRALKAMPLAVRAPRPIEEAISSAGGVTFDAVNDDLMLTALPGVFVAGEMLDWEA